MRADAYARLNLDNLIGKIVYDAHALRSSPTLRFAEIAVFINIVEIAKCKMLTLYFVHSFRQISALHTVS